ncbi:MULTISPECIES: excalibur calcium-binding domain-containing protein [Phenylobacterium]|uniref:Excalibur calcium-binding domain-containing protein n=1 Tax=Phenylobacterium koreense TaxID=266125 RepID=A0ABV2ENZ1_9CAUL
MGRHMQAAIVAAIALLPVSAFGHPGGLDASGCHNNRKTGDYHCHRGGGRPQAERTPPRQALGFASAPAQRAYPNCAAARAAGAAPVRRGEPGYGPHLDRDNDGVGCEPYRGR